MNARYRFLAIGLTLLPFASVTWELLAGTKETGERKTETNRAGASDSSSQLSGQELWSMNCQRCHNMRPPNLYNATQWQVIVHHMRIRGNITGADARAIAEFLKSGSP